MSKEQDEFKWDEKTVLEFVGKTIHDRLEWALLHDAGAAPVPIQLALKSFIESKQQPKSQEWEIVSFKNDLHKGIFNRLANGRFIDSTDEETMIKYYSIHSVKRLSDSAVFSVGDEVETSHKSRYTIKSFYIAESDVFAKLDTGNSLNILFMFHPPKPVREVLFRSIDGEDICEGDFYYAVSDDFNLYYTSFAKKEWAPSKVMAWKAKEKAEEYILLNKPCLSVNDVESCLGKYLLSGFVVEKVTEVAKEKINK